MDENRRACARRFFDTLKRSAFCCGYPADQGSRTIANRVDGVIGRDRPPPGLQQIGLTTPSSSGVGPARVSPYDLEHRSSSRVTGLLGRAIEPTMGSTGSPPPKLDDPAARGPRDTVLGGPVWRVERIFRQGETKCKQRKHPAMWDTISKFGLLVEQTFAAFQCARRSNILEGGLMVDRLV